MSYQQTIMFLCWKATDDEGNVLPEFEKVLDIDIKAAAEEKLGKTLDQNLLSVVFDYDGNLWFATGGFRIYPDRKQQGAVGYISRAAIDSILNGEEINLSDAVFVYELTPGEGAEKRNFCFKRWRCNPYKYKTVICSRQIME